ncbi:hypothetical protein THAOC_35950 [Thalassiosira oceanica]|uniref:D-isomer specific 2-hydroxyacid dehydrogenase NAD-binding domain-containing protein n=1 Tax=Thalassiosira oceanica TaxID=159749 RepID=K0R105_THAOC|nr:hypothetical protein THAOC_35950 [Thalassiosira oceanica]|eukprot:EJK45440.1 hypothetical protein THAOC_35950 [Thalassiosira oceanica]
MRLSSAAALFVSASRRPRLTSYQSQRLFGSSSTASPSPETMGRYFNREESLPTKHEGPVVKEARILALCDADDEYNRPLYEGPLPENARLLKIGSSLAEFDVDEISEQHPNVIFVSHPKSRVPLVEGMFSSTLAEYCMLAISYFAKDLPRLMRQKNDVNWEQYPVSEIRGSTLGVVGYGDIGRASAKLAKAYGMRVIGLKRNAEGFSDPYCDDVYGMDRLHDLMAESDYILVSAPLTDQTRGMISAEALSHCKRSAVVINVGRGPIIDEEALVDALQNNRIRGAGLDVMTVEPLPKDSPLWKLDNVLLSPHNMDMTLSFMKESTQFFIDENLPRFVRGQELLNPVDLKAGY